MLIHLKEKDYELILKTIIAFLIFYPVIHLITENRMAYHYGFMYKLGNAEEFVDKFGVSKQWVSCIFHMGISRLEGFSDRLESFLLISESSIRGP